MYTYTYIFSKKTNLLPYLESKHFPCVTQSEVDCYAKERDVKLILLVRYEHKRTARGIVSHCICKIKCPINPLPIKGEFEAVSVAQMCKLLRGLGWEPKEEYAISLFE